MPVTVILSTTLRAYVPGYNPVTGLCLDLSEWPNMALPEEPCPDLPQPLTTGDLADQLKLPRAEIKIIMLNGRHAEFTSLVQDGDRIGYFPAVGGG